MNTNLRNSAPPGDRLIAIGVPEGVGYVRK